MERDGSEREWMDDEARFVEQEQAELREADARSEEELARVFPAPFLRGTGTGTVRPSGGDAIGEDLPLCVSCNAAEATMERADGEYVCASCYADAADRDFDRLNEQQHGDRQ